MTRISARSDQIEARKALQSCNAFRRTEPWLRRMAALTLRDEYAPKMLERIIGGDNVFYEAALRSVSAGTGAPTVPTTIEVAVCDYGYQEVRDCSLVLGVHLCNRDLAAFADLDPVTLTLQAVAVWTACTELGDSTIAGLVANIGIGGLAAVHGSAYRSLIGNLAGSSMPLHEAESAAFGLDHALMSATMLKEVGFNDGVCYDVEHHAAPDSGNEVIGLAEVVAHQLGFTGGIANASAELTSQSMASFGVVEQSMTRIVTQVGARVLWAEKIIKHVS